MVVLWTTKIRGVWELIKLEMFGLNVWEFSRPVRLSWNTYASLVSLGLLCATRPYIYLYPLSDVSLNVVVRLNSHTMIVIATIFFPIWQDFQTQDDDEDQILARAVALSLETPGL